MRCSGALDDRQRRQQTAGEDVLLDPVRAAALLVVGSIGVGDRLEADAAAALQHPVAGLEEGGEVLVADRLDISIETMASNSPLTSR